jgi:hypothetical protein
MAHPSPEMESIIILPKMTAGADGGWTNRKASLDG